jgi:hypothetical protein
MATQIFDRSNLKVNTDTQDAILKAYNNTYGKGINPDAVPDLLKALKNLLKQARQDSFSLSHSVIDTPYEEQASEAIKKALNL